MPSYRKMSDSQGPEKKGETKDIEGSMRKASPDESFLTASASLPSS